MGPEAMKILLKIDDKLEGRTNSWRVKDNVFEAIYHQILTFGCEHGCQHKREN